MAATESASYRRIRRLISQDRCVILDGGMATELERTEVSGYRVSDQNLWGTWALYNNPGSVLEVHKGYLAAGCDVISTDTWGITDAPRQEVRTQFQQRGGSWMDMARQGVRLARQAIQEAGRKGRCAVAFSINGDIVRPQHLQTLELLTRALKSDPPDLILMETMTLIREDLTVPAVEVLLGTGIPVWLSFRRCREGVCGLYGQHWGGPEGDLFGRAARRFEEMGVSALLVNCLPASHVLGMLPWLRDFSDLPLGVYPNVGHYLDPGWKFDEGMGPEAYASLAQKWREEGAQIVGGCCGVTREHIAAVRTELAKTGPSRAKAAAPDPTKEAVPSAPTQCSGKRPETWHDAKGGNLYPLPFPQILADPDVFRPTQGSFLTWKHLLASGDGQGKRCLDVGCGAGILTVQLALNGAQHVRAIDIQQEAVANTLANAFRNGVADRVSGEVVDLYAYLPAAKYEVVVASLYQMPVDPFGEPTGHRPLDYWGRNLLDHLISLLPDLLEPHGVAYLMQISLLSQARTAELLRDRALDSKVIDFAFLPFTPTFDRHLEQIQRVEQLSDAYHLTFGDENVLVMYLLEIRHLS